MVNFDGPPKDFLIIEFSLSLVVLGLGFFYCPLGKTVLFMLTLNLEALLPEDATDPTQNANPATTSMKMPSPMNNGKSAETSEMPPAQSWSPQNSEIAKELEMISPRSSGISLCIYRKITGNIYEARTSGPSSARSSAQGMDSGIPCHL